MKVVMLECDQGSFDVEAQVAAARGVEFAVAHAASPQEVVAVAGDADAILIQYMSVDGSLLDMLPTLRAVGRYGVGIETVDVAAATARGVAVCSVPDYGSETASDHAIALALAVARKIVRFDRAMRVRSVDVAEFRPMHEVSGRRFGIVGVGRIGSAVARKAQGLGFEVVGHDPWWVARSPQIPLIELDELLRTSHVVSFHVPLTDVTDHLLDGPRIDLLRADAVVVNTSRGRVVDTLALARSLAAERIAGAGIDVFEEEPLPFDHPLVALDNVTLSPHIAWYSEESYVRLKRRVIENVIDVCQDRVPHSIVNPEVLPVVRKIVSG
jgi:D-3-phosphoglycerate dehydrogenase